MTSAEVLDVARDSLWTLILVSGPLMFVALIIGLGISLIQALTQIQEQTLTFVPKMIAMIIGLLILFPFMGRSLGSLTERLAAKIISG
jgi:flagellar biosynthesis protein FliQ